MVTTMEFEQHHLSYFPPVGRYHFAGFQHDGNEVYAVMTAKPSGRPDPVELLSGAGSGVYLKCDSQTLAALHDALPDGAERDYIAAIYDAVEALNEVNMNFREAMRLAQRPSTVAQFSETAGHSTRTCSKKLESAIARIQAFDPEHRKPGRSETYKL